MSAFYRFMFLVLVAYLGYAALGMLFQRHLIYPGRTLAPPVIASGVAARAEKLWVITSFGKVEARLALNKVTTPQPAVIFFHGNGELVDELSPELEELKRDGFAVMLVEYPGYGKSSGRPQEKTLDEAAIAAFDMLAQRPEIDSARIVAFGFSIGSGPAVALAVSRPVKALVLAAPLASLKPFAYKRLLPSFLLQDKFNNVEIIKSYKGPVLVLHGTEDKVIPFDHGRMVAASASNARFVALPAGHNDLMDSPAFWQEVLQFLKHVKSVDGK